MSESPFDAPPSDNGKGDQQSSAGPDEADLGFQEPDASALGDPAMQLTGDAFGGVSDELLTVHQQVAEAIRSQDRGQRLQTVSADFGQGRQAEASGLGGALVQAVGIGPSEPGHGEPGQTALYVYTAEESTESEVRQILAESMGVQSLGDSQRVPLITRKASFEAQEHRFRIRPAYGGVSVGHNRVTAGTFGGMCVGRRDPRNRRAMVLSNNHVLANSNNANAGDCIVQPGTYDGGKCATDQIAILEAYVPIRFGGPVNYVDAATGWAWPDRVRAEHLYRWGNSLYLFRVGSSPIFPQLGMTVGKTGRTTQLTQGRVININWSGWVNYGVGYAWFERQFVVQSTSSAPFSAGGDSGSWIWQWVNGLPPVGLLFAGGGGLTIGSPMPWVTQLLDVNLVTTTYW